MGGGGGQAGRGELSRGGRARGVDLTNMRLRPALTLLELAAACAGLTRTSLPRAPSCASTSSPAAAA